VLDGFSADGLADDFWARAVVRFGLGFEGRGDVFRAGSVHDFLGLLGAFGGDTMNRQQNLALLDASGKVLRFVLRNSQADQTAGDAAHRAAHADAGQGGENWARGDKWAEAGNRQQAYAGEPAERAADQRAGTGSGGKSFWSFAGLGDVIRYGNVLWQQDRYVGIGKASFAQSVCLLYTSRCV